MVEIQNLTKYYGSKAALKGISFTIKENEVLGFLGPNGAGKSTTLNIMAGVIPSTGGTVKITNFHVVKADGFQNRTPHHRLIVIKRQTQEAAALLIVDILTAGKVRKEQNTVGAHRNLSGTIIQIVVVNRVIGLVADIVLKPAQS